MILGRTLGLGLFPVGGLSQQGESRDDVVARTTQSGFSFEARANMR